MIPARDIGQEMPGWQGLHTSQSEGHGSKTRVPGPSLLACVEFPGDPETPPRPAHLLLQGALGHPALPPAESPTAGGTGEPSQDATRPRGPSSSTHGSIFPKYPVVTEMRLHTHLLSQGAGL